jgi:hypothetical protein
MRDSLIGERVETEVELGESSNRSAEHAGDVVLEYFDKLGSEDWQVGSQLGEDYLPRGVYLLGRELPTAREH